MRYLYLVSIFMLAAAASGADWSASVRTVLVNDVSPGSGYVSSARFTADLRGYLQLRYFDEEAGIYWIAYGPTGNEYLSDARFSPSDRVLFWEISGDGNKVAFCEAAESGDLPYRDTCRLYLEDRGLYESFLQQDGSSAVFTFANAYPGPSDMALNHDGSIVMVGSACCDTGFFGRVEAWQRQPDGVYKKVVSQVEEAPGLYYQPEIGKAVAVSDSAVATIIDPGYGEEMNSAEVLVYDLTDTPDTPLSSPTARIALPVESLGLPYANDSLSMNRSGSHLSVALRPEYDPNIPSPNGAVVLFEKTDEGWRQKGQLIEASALLDDLGFYYYFGLVGISDSGDSVAIVAAVECSDEDDDPIDPCYAGFLTVWDFNEDSDDWEPRLGEGLPVALPLISAGTHSTVEAIFDETANAIGVAINGPGQDYLLRATLEQQSSNSGLPIWLLYEASQQ